MGFAFLKTYQSESEYESVIVDSMFTCVIDNLEKCTSPVRDCYTYAEFYEEPLSIQCALFYSMI